MATWRCGEVDGEVDGEGRVLGEERDVVLGVGDFRGVWERGRAFG